MQPLLHRRNFLVRHVCPTTHMIVTGPVREILPLPISSISPDYLKTTNFFYHKTIGNGWCCNIYFGIRNTDNSWTKKNRILRPNLRSFATHQTTSKFLQCDLPTSPNKQVIPCALGTCNGMQCWNKCVKWRLQAKSKLRRASATILKISNYGVETRNSWKNHLFEWICFY